LYSTLCTMRGKRLHSFFFWLTSDGAFHKAHFFVMLVRFVMWEVRALSLFCLFMLAMVLYFFLGCLVLCQMIALLCWWFALCYFLFLISLSLLMHAITSCSFYVHQDLFSFCIITCEVIYFCLLCTPLHLRFINFCSLCVPLPVRLMPAICCVWCCFCQSHPLCFVCHHFSFVLCPITCEFILQCYLASYLGNSASSQCCIFCAPSL
jgi:hypothetical protein